MEGRRDRFRDLIQRNEHLFGGWIGLGWTMEGIRRDIDRELVRRGFRVKFRLVIVRDRASVWAGGGQGLMGWVDCRCASSGFRCGCGRSLTAVFGERLCLNLNSGD